MDAGLLDEFQGRIGILGGSFDPVHIGHLLLAQTACEQLNLDRVLLMPCARQPHKPGSPAAPGELRREMLDAAVRDDLRIDVLDIELRRGGVSYTIDSICEIKRLFPKAELFFLIGADAVRDLHRWKDIDRIQALCTLRVFARPGFDVATLLPEDVGLPLEMASELLENVIRTRQMDVSSSEIRYRIAEGMSIRYLVPPEVDMLIFEHHLYCVK